MDRRPPRCPDYADVQSVDDLLPYLDAVARRPHHQGLHAAWDLKPGERVLLCVDNWHDPMSVEAMKKTLERFGCTYEVQIKDRGPMPVFEGHNEVEYYFARTKELAEWMDTWERIDAEGSYDKILQGYGGPILSERRVKIQRVPFITREMIASEAHTLPHELLHEIDRRTWVRLRRAARIRITDPEGTDIAYTNHAEYWDERREDFNVDYISKWFPQNVAFSKTYMPGHVWGRPWFFVGAEDGEGVIAGTMNHIGPFPRIEMDVRASKIVDIRGGGLFGEKLRRVMEETKDLQYPGFNGKGLLHWWEASMGTNPKIHRPRKDFLHGLNCGLYERMRSGVIHIGYGTIISSWMERLAAKEGLPVGHFHIHLYFGTVELTMPEGHTERLIDAGRLTVLDDPEVRRVAERFGDPDVLLAENWIPAVPGINMTGDYDRDYAADPLDWTLTELHVCRKWHDLYMKMVMPGDGPAHCH
ncbi:MAG: hypothetical protein KGM44_05935 [bacterium]|nr:hypothetical protein [bacterium]